MEQAFGVPGLGRALVTAIIERDIIVVQNLVLLYALIFVGVNVLVDLSYAWLDPRIRLPVAGPCAPLLRQNWLAALGGPGGPPDRGRGPGRPADRPARSAQGRLPPHEQAARAQSFFGTDQVGRDTLSRVIYGARTSLFVAFSAVLLGTTVGSLWGVACGYLGGRFDLVSQRVMEILQSFPDLILAMAISMAIGTGLPAVIVAIAITRIPFGGRVIRSVALCVSEMPFVEAGRAAGASQLRVMTLHVLPQCVAPYLVLATTHLGVAIVIEAALGFLGVGVPPPTPTWGNMLADAITGLVPQWWLVLFPGLGHHDHGARVQSARRRHP